MPRVWADSIEEHKREVRDAILDSAALLSGTGGVRALTMSQIAESAGIGRATLYKYFSGIDEILLAWHERQVAAHLDDLEQVAAREADPYQRLIAVLTTYAAHAHQPRSRDLYELAHGGEPHDLAHARVRALIEQLIDDAAHEGSVRSDVSAHELATFSLHAMAAARDLRAKTAIGRLTELVMEALAPR